MKYPHYKLFENPIRIQNQEVRNKIFQYITEIVKKPITQKDLTDGSKSILELRKKIVATYPLEIWLKHALPLDLSDYKTIALACYKDKIFNHNLLHDDNYKYYQKHYDDNHVILLDELEGYIVPLLYIYNINYQTPFIYTVTKDNHISLYPNDRCVLINLKTRELINRSYLNNPTSFQNFLIELNYYIDDPSKEVERYIEYRFGNTVNDMEVVYE